MVPFCSMDLLLITEQNFSFLLPVINCTSWSNQVASKFWHKFRSECDLSLEMRQNCSTNYEKWLKVCCIPPNLGGCEKSRLWVGNGGSVSQMECQTSNITANVQSDHAPSALIHSSSLFATDQLHRPARSVDIQSCRNASATRPYRRLVLDMHQRIDWTNEKDEKFVHFTR